MQEADSTALKLRELSEKISSLSVNQQRQEQLKVESIHEHLRKLEDEFSKQRPIEQSKLQLLKDQISRSSEVIKSEAGRIGSKFSVIEEKVDGLKNTMNAWVEHEKGKQSGEKTARADVNNNELMALCEMIEKEESVLYDRFEENYESISAKVNALKEDLHREESEREDNVIRIADSMESELDRFKEAMEAEARQREESEQKIRTMVGEIRGKLVAEVEKQVKRRAECNNLMLQLLETACQRMERKGR